MINNYYLKLKPEIHYVKGIRKGALYDLIKGRLISLDEKKSKFIELLEKNYSLSKIIEMGNFAESEVVNLLDFLFREDIIIKCDSKTYIDKYTYGFPKFLLGQPLLKVPTLATAYIEVCNICNLECYFCNAPKYYGCLACTKSNTDDNVLKDNIFEILSYLNDLNCKNIVLFGGNPFLDIESLKNICLLLMKFNFQKIIVLTNGFELNNKEVIDLIRYYNLHIFITIFYPFNIYERLSKGKYRFREVLKNILKLDETGINYNISLVLTKSVNISDILEQLKEDFERKDINAIPIYCYDFSLSKDLLNPPSIAEYELMKIYNPCLYGKITITYDCKYLLCPLIKDYVLGNIKNKELIDILEDLEKYYKITKDKIEPCKYCEFRYACLDCRAYEVLRGSSLYKTNYCNYNPLLGEWR